MYFIRTVTLCTIWILIKREAQMLITNHKRQARGKGTKCHHLFIIVIERIRLSTVSEEHSKPLRLLLSFDSVLAWCDFDLLHW